MLAIVAEKTGYPPEMLDLELDLEADLGIDTVKQAEMFAAIREAYGIERDDKLKLRDYPTLAHVVRFVHDARRSAAPVDARARTARRRRRAGARRAPAAATGSRPRVLAMVAEQTGYPPELLDWTWIWRRISASTRSSRPRCSRRSARRTGSSATTR